MLAEIKSNFERLVALYESQKERADYLSAELQKARESGEAYLKQIDNLKGQIENLKLAGAFSNGGDSSTASKEIIDKLVREIDKCISLLEKD